MYLNINKDNVTWLLWEDVPHAYDVQIFCRSKLCLATTIHNIKWLKIYEVKSVIF